MMIAAQRKGHAMGSYFHVIERKVGGNLDAFRRELGRLRESGHFHRDRHERIMRIAKTVGFGHIVRQCLVDTGHRAGCEVHVLTSTGNKPALRTDNILTSYIKSAIGTSGIFITLGSILILENIFGITTFVTPEYCADPELYKKTFMFAFFIYSIIFNSLNTRSEKLNLFEHINENKRFLVVMGAIFVMQTVIIQIGGQVFNTTTLSIRALVISMLLALLIIPVDMVRKMFVRKKK